MTPARSAIVATGLRKSFGDSAVLAVGWCAVIGLVGYVWARAAFGRSVPMSA
jgi:ABC-2 type transport system permease protein